MARNLEALFVARILLGIVGNVRDFALPRRSASEGENFLDGNENELELDSRGTASRVSGPLGTDSKELLDEIRDMFEKLDRDEEIGTEGEEADGESKEDSEKYLELELELELESEERESGER